jgi:hypothetical protein
MMVRLMAMMMEMMTEILRLMAMPMEMMTEILRLMAMPMLRVMPMPMLRVKLMEMPKVILKAIMKHCLPLIHINMLLPLKLRNSHPMHYNRVNMLQILICCHISIRIFQMYHWPHDC